MSGITFDNLFDAVTDNQQEANELQTRADLMIVIREIVDDRGWNQAQAAEKMDLTQPRVRDLLNGKLDTFSIDLLMTYLFRLGYRLMPVYKNRQLTMTVIAV